MNLAQRIGKGMALALLYAALLAIAAVTVFPLLYSVMGSLKHNMELQTSDRLLPLVYTWENYRYAWGQVDFSRYTLNSLLIASGVVAGSVVNSTMTGYVLSRKAFPGRAGVRSLYIWSMFVALGPAVLYPKFQIVVDLGLNRSYLGIIVIQMASQAANIFLVESYLSSVSREFDEAAKIDGCGFFRVYWNIILPLILPVAAIIALLMFKASWNDYLMPMVITMGNEKLMPLTVAVVGMKSSGETATQWTVMLAGTTISIIPVVLMYIFANKQFISGLTLGGVKG